MSEPWFLFQRYYTPNTTQGTNNKSVTFKIQSNNSENPPLNVWLKKKAWKCILKEIMNSFLFAGENLPCNKNRLSGVYINIENNVISTLSYGDHIFPLTYDSNIWLFCWSLKTNCA